MVNNLDLESLEFDDDSLVIPLTREARKKASEFSQGIKLSSKAEQIRLNTLAVYGVNDYLQLLGIPTNLSAGDCWNPILRLGLDVADLVITGLGKLECRPVKKNDNNCQIPVEVWEERLGYIIVEIAPNEREAELLGFLKNIQTETVALNQLLPVDNLIDELIPETSLVAKKVVNLRQWLQNNLEEALASGWQFLEDLMSSQQQELAFSLRSSSQFVQANSVKLSRVINLGEHSVILLVGLQDEGEEKVRFLIQIHPESSQQYLPPNLQLILIDDESGTTIQQVTAQNQDNFIQLKRFAISEQGSFQLKISLDNYEYQESFSI